MNGARGLSAQPARGTSDRRARSSKHSDPMKGNTCGCLLDVRQHTTCKVLRRDQFKGEFLPKLRGKQAGRAAQGTSRRRLGLGMGATWTLPRIVGPALAADLLFTGRILDVARPSASDWSTGPSTKGRR